MILDRMRNDASAWSLAASNLVTLGFALKEHWSLTTVMFIYWGQNIIIGILNFFRILSLELPPSKPEVPAKFAFGAKLFIACFFAVHYGFFHFGYYSFLRPHFSGQDSIFIMSSLFIFLCHHVFSFFYNFQDDRQSWDLGRLMFYPYQRIIPMHLTIIFGTVPMMIFRGQLAEQLVLAFFLLLKTWVDLKMHLMEHSYGLSKKAV